MKKWRLRVLTKLAQQANNTPPQGQQGEQPPPQQGGHVQASPSLETYFPSVRTGWENQSGNVINLVGLLDKAVIAGTNSKYNFKYLFENNSSIPGIASGFTSPVSDVINLIQKVIVNYLNNKTPYTTRDGGRKQKASVVSNAPELSKFTQIKPDSDLAKSGVSYAAIKALADNIFNQAPQQ